MVECPALDFSSGHDHTVMRLSPESGSVLSVEPLKILSLHGAPGWLIQLSVQLLILAQVMISWFTGSSPALGFALIVWSLLGILSPPLSAPTLLTRALSLKINLKKERKKSQKTPNSHHSSTREEQSQRVKTMQLEDLVRLQKS